MMTMEATTSAMTYLSRVDLGGDCVRVSDTVETGDSDAVSSPWYHVDDQRRYGGVVYVDSSRRTSVLAVAVTDADHMRRDTVSEQR